MRLHGALFISRHSVLASHVQWLVLGFLSLAFAQRHPSSPPWAPCRAFLLHREMEPRARLQATQQQERNHLPIPHPFPPYLATPTYRIASSKANVALDTTPWPTNLPSTHPPVLPRSSATVKMPNAKKNNPAVWIGGQRRKIARKSGTNTAVPRSSTMPAISPDSAAAGLASSVSGLGAGIPSDGLAVEDRNRNQYEDMDPEDYYPPPSRVTQ
jgi:hypothetical protein